VEQTNPILFVTQTPYQSLNLLILERPASHRKQTSRTDEPQSISKLSGFYGKDEAVYHFDQ
jgi:hypothetical protein